MTINLGGKIFVLIHPLGGINILQGKNNMLGIRFDYKDSFKSLFRSLHEFRPKLLF
jgi:hypothetical protein